MDFEYFDQAMQRPSRALELDNQNGLVIVFPYTTEYLERVRKIPGRWWNPQRSGDKYWHAPLTPEALEKAIELFPGFKISSLLAKHVEALYKSDEIKPPPPEDAPQPDWIKIDLFPFQRIGVAALLNNNAALLADDMGLGKTFQGIAWASYRVGATQNKPSEGPLSASGLPVCGVCGKPLLGAKTSPAMIKHSCASKVHRRLTKKRIGVPYGCLVVTPATVKYNWEQAIHRARPGDKVIVIDSGMNIPKAGSMDWVVLNYDILDKHLEALYAFNPATIVLDESHYIKNQKAIRTQMATSLCLTTPRKLLITGTPILNRPVELWPQLLALGRVRDEQFFNWAKRYCDAKKMRVSWNREVWDFTGASNLKELWHSLQPFTVRRLKKDVLPDLPDILYSETLMPLSPQYALAYAEEVAAYEEWLAERERDEVPPTAGEHLTHQSVLRQLTVSGKVLGLIERLGDYAETNTKAVIFCTFLQAGLFQLRDQLPKTYKYVMITGEQSARERKEAQDRFQQDPTVLFALCSTMAANVGIDLFAASTVIFLDNPWVPGMRDQAVARTHRIGQLADKVQVIDLIGMDTIDEAVLRVLRRKKGVIDQAIDGIAPVTALSEGALALSVAQDFTARRSQRR